MSKLSDAAEHALERKVDRLASASTAGVVWNRSKNWLNGKKTAIGLTIVALPTVVAGLRDIALAFGANPTTVVRVVGGILTAIGIVHKVIKGLQAAGVLESDDAPADRREVERRTEDQIIAAAVAKEGTLTVKHVDEPGSVTVRYTDAVTGVEISEEEAKWKLAEEMKARGK